MKCQMRRRNPAAMYVKATANGKLIERALCDECTQKAGYGNFLYPLALDFNSLLGSFFGNPVPKMTDAVRCPGCGSSLRGIAQSGKTGCAECYNTFRDCMMPSIQRIHGNTEHFGRCPSSRALQVKPKTRLSVALQEDTELSRRRKELREAIESQDFECATVLCDGIKALEGGGKA